MFTEEIGADWYGDVNDRTLTTGYYFNHNGRGATLKWDVKKQGTVALSSQEAENQSLTAAVQEAWYLIQLLEDLGMQQKHPEAIGEDNQSCIKCAKNQSCTRRAITLRQNFTSFCWKKWSISNYYVPTDKMVADIFTKSFSASKMETFRTVLMGINSTQSAQG